MSTLSQFGGNRATKSIVNAFSDSGWAGVSVSNPGRTIASGSLTANTLKTILTVTGAGTFHGLSFRTANVTSRTIRIRITLDGVVVFDSTSAAISTGTTGAILTGSSAYPVSPISFNTSAVVEIASSLTETDGISMIYVLEGK
jgi:hypothetical protein